MTDKEWIKQAYPLQQVVVKLQGTRLSDRSAIIDQIEVVLEKLRSGDTKGCAHDDDFGYSFELTEASAEASFFDAPQRSSVGDTIK